MVPADLEPTLQKLQCSGVHQITYPQKMALSEKGTALEKVIETWPVLPDSIKASILLIINQFTQNH
jgi:hypothetical protein